MMMAQLGGGSIDYTLLPLTFKCRTGGDLSIKNENTSWDRNFEYSLNDGAWTVFSLPKSSGVLLIATLSPGDTISFRRDNDNFYQAKFVSDSSLTFDIYGNLLSLQYGSAFNGQTALRNTTKQAFGYTFQGVNVVDASNLKLTATTLSAGCYQSMFQGCVLLQSIPELPATTMKLNCYRNMFRDCSSLESLPQLPATTLAANCYNAMFCKTAISSIPVNYLSAATTMAEGCYSSLFKACPNLTSVPSDLLPSTTLAKSCYDAMFANCAMLTSAPELPATTLAEKCYVSMFTGCTNLTTAPELPATTLITYCYNLMFDGCSKLNYIKAMFTTTPSASYTSNWVRGVASSGTFVKNSAATWEVIGGSGIPSGWTVIDAT
jgi:hypothetical protein